MRFTRFVSGTLAVAIALGASAPIAFADSKSAAQKLFDEGAALMAKKDYAAACPKIKASMELEPTDGTVLRLAVCYQALGRWSSSWGLFKESISRAERATPPRKDRIEMATKGIAEVEKHLSYVTIQVKPDARAAGLEVKLDGEKVVEGTYGASVPIDPGSHTLAASAPGRKAWETTFSIATSAETKTLDVPRLDEEPAAAVTAPTSAATTTTPGPGDVPRETPPPAGTPTVAYVALGAGVLFLGGAVVARLKMGSERDDYFARCAEQASFVCDDPDGRSRVRTWEAVSWISGAVGLAAVGVGVTLIVTSPRGESKKTTVTASPATLAGGAPGLVISGAF